MNENKMLNTEWKLFDFFLKIKQGYKDNSFIFLSKRFFLVYSILVKKYPEIELENCSLQENITNKPKGKVVYLNDINYELPEKLRLIDSIITYGNLYNLDLCRSGNFCHIPSITEQDKINSGNSNLFIPRKFKNKLKYRIHLTKKAAIDLLVYEINFLSENNVIDVLTLAPDFLYNYFNFCVNNQEILYYYLQEIELRKLLNVDKTMKDVEKLKQELIKEISEKYGIENISQELMYFLINDNTYNYLMLHEPIKISNTSKEQVKQISK